MVIVADNNLKDSKVRKIYELQGRMVFEKEDHLFHNCKETTVEDVVSKMEVDNDSYENLETKETKVYYETNQAILEDSIHVNHEDQTTTN